MSLTLNALDRFFMAWSDDGQDQNLANAEAYVWQRMVDAGALKQEMTFSFYTEDSLRCRIYGHTIIISVKDNAVHCGQAAGGGDFYPKGTEAGEDPMIFDDIKQVVAYILATNW